MKTKIIYISGGELFEMAQIRAAFEEVKTTLGLDKDTILFGVPVDCDNAIENISDNITEQPTNITQIIPETPEIPESPTDISENQIIDENPESPVATDAPVVPESDADVATDAPVVPILSVLAINEDDAIESEQDTNETEHIIAEDITDVTESVADDVTDDIADDVAVSIVTETVVVTDIADEQLPEVPMEKTLEQLLESMTPLREDTTPLPDADDVPENAVTDAPVFSSDDTDATLAQLASEFAQTKDTISTNSRAETSGKIGKLKNILPFKKAKREDNSLMGDLFGWAGIAANDEDFSIPGFFTPAKKQGA